MQTREQFQVLLSLADALGKDLVLAFLFAMLSVVLWFLREQELRDLLAGARHPARNIDQNMACLLYTSPSPRD